MTLKEILKDKHISMYSLAKATGMPYSTLNDIVNARIEPASIRSGDLRAIAGQIGMSMDQLYDQLSESFVIEIRDVQGRIRIINRQYYVSFKYDGTEVTEPVAKADAESSIFIKTLAGWKMEDYISDRELEALCSTI
ncbi:MAG: helix-turn-helix transcriptional regulator [Lachnospiraceae bacterium]|nr:helix-turn-helix transcriptional regulator [Lachnospiraceae bacterium]